MTDSSRSSSGLHKNKSINTVSTVSTSTSNGVTRGGSNGDSSSGSSGSRLITDSSSSGSDGGADPSVFAAKDRSKFLSQGIALVCLNYRTPM